MSSFRKLDPRLADAAARVAAIAVFGYFLFGDVQRIRGLWAFLDIPGLEGAVWQRIVAKASDAAFVTLVVVLFIVRRGATRKAAGPWPRVAALVGTFLYPLSLQLFERLKWIASSTDPDATLVGASMVVAGYVLATVSLAFLGRSFSINAEARRLVTRGPYALVRHPLYVAETLAATGMAVHFAAWPCFAMLAVHVALQAWRAINEERVLADAFGAEWATYRAGTRWFLPGVW